MPIPWIEEFPAPFPAIEQALDEPNGLLAAGADLSVPRLLDAYRQGIFPWYEEGQPVLWWSPNPRMILRPQAMLMSRSLLREIRKPHYTVTMDEAFTQVVTCCAAPRQDSAGTWITAEMQQAYSRLHQHGHAHSVEVWRSDELVGGIYGVALGKIFFGESMFSARSNTSKIALAYLAECLKMWEFELIDCQVSSAHLRSLGAIDVSRAQFKLLLEKYVADNDNPPSWRLQSGLFARVSDNAGAGKGHS